MNAKIATSNMVSFFIRGVPYIYTADQLGANFGKLRDEVFNGTDDSVLALMTSLGLLQLSKEEKNKILETFSEGVVSVDKDGVASYKTESGYEIKLPNILTDKIRELFFEGFDFEYMKKFIGNLMQNPKESVREELYLFLESGSIPITDDGCFLAYKRVNSDLESYHASPDGTHLKHEIGTVVEMPREQVDDNRQQTCSRGLHFCSFSYLKEYYGGSGAVIILKINPRDVVSIPSDYRNSKGRACRYEVLAIHNEGDQFDTLATKLVDGVNPSRNRVSERDIFLKKIKTKNGAGTSELEKAIVEKATEIKKRGSHKNEDITILIQRSNLGKKNRLTRDFIRGVLNANGVSTKEVVVRQGVFRSQVR